MCHIYVFLWYFSGGSLDRYGQIPENVLGVIAVAVVRGLQYLWSLKIMHRGTPKMSIYVGLGRRIVILSLI